jgi:1D-myo-inositol-tetrakisphosphate 5-kinase/inositol-polyphosphate multikinase
MMEDILGEFVMPCVLDIKLGKRLWARDASDGKREQMNKLANETSSGTLGLRVTGAGWFEQSEGEEGKFHRMDKMACRQWQTWEELVEGINSVLDRASLDNPERRQTQRSSLVHTLKELLAVFPSSIRLISASLLVAVDAGSDRARLVLIDFAHSEWVHPRPSNNSSQETDYEYDVERQVANVDIKACLERLVSVFEEL